MHVEARTLQGEVTVLPLMPKHLGLALFHGALVADAIGRVGRGRLALGTDGCDRGCQYFLRTVEMTAGEGEVIPRRWLKGLLGS